MFTNHKKLIAIIVVAAILTIAVVPTLVKAALDDPTGNETPPTQLGDSTGMEVPPASPIQVSLILSSYPGVGQETTATLTIIAAWDMQDVVAKIELPANSTVNGGQVDWTGSLKANEPVTLQANISFVQTGNFEIRGSALATESEDASYSDVAYSYLIVGQDSGMAGLAPEQEGLGQTEQVEAGDTAPVVSSTSLINGVPTGPEPPSLDLEVPDSVTQ